MSKGSSRPPRWTNTCVPSARTLGMVVLPAGQHPWQGSAAVWQSARYLAADMLADSAVIRSTAARTRVEGKA